ncbi:MAG TPA: NAD(P)-dependent oxidoreductase [Bryobacteraceae bacterium]|jgi:glutamate synthase (NADPH/NADH) small chain|nr:NAD(P)-dependent oxidoreductase [Bryobacteraceae bacterium]
MDEAQLPVPRNLEQFPELHPPFDRPGALVEANRCLFCFDAPCTAACPTHIDVPRFIKKIASENLRGAALTILDANILGLSCARVCPVDVLCEGACVLDRYNQKPIEIGRLQRYAMDNFYAKGADVAWAAHSAQPRSGKIACVGGGPASLACSAELHRRGFAVTVFDNRPLPGGLNTYGVAEYKLRPSDSLREVELVRSLGVEFRQQEIGLDPSLATIEKQFDRIFLGLGLGSMLRLGIPGEQASGVVDALRFIARYKTSHDVAVGRRVVVIGGGNTAIDAANAASRLGAPEVHVFYRRGEKDMPAFASEYENSKIESVRFHFLAQPLEILQDNGRVAGVRFIGTRLAQPDASGRRPFEPVPGTGFVFPCDMVIPALGQSRMVELLEAIGVAVDNGSIAVDRPTGRTANPKYYAGGDCVNGGREVVDAVADGKRAATAIALSLESQHG